MLKKIVENIVKQTESDGSYDDLGVIPNVTSKKNIIDSGFLSKGKFAGKGILKDATATVQEEKVDEVEKVEKVEDEDDYLVAYDITDLTGIFRTGTGFQGKKRFSNASKAKSSFGRDSEDIMVVKKSEYEKKFGKIPNV